MLAQTVFLLWGCDWDLCGDEAEYWAWSRKLDWSYFARGPVIAWLIRLGTEVLGGLSLKLTGSLMFAVRFPCVILGGLDGVGGLPAHDPDDDGHRIGLHRRVAASGDSHLRAGRSDRDLRHAARVLLGVGGRLDLPGRARQMI